MKIDFESGTHGMYYVVWSCFDKILEKVVWSLRTRISKDIITCLKVDSFRN